MKYTIRAVTKFEIRPEGKAPLYHAASVTAELENLRGVEHLLSQMAYTKGYIADVIDQLERAIEIAEED